MPIKEKIKNYNAFLRLFLNLNLKCIFYFGKDIRAKMLLLKSVVNSNESGSIFNLYFLASYFLGKHIFKIC